jgi:hypothetical protein
LSISSGRVPLRLGDSALEPVQVVGLPELSPVVSSVHVESVGYPADGFEMRTLQCSGCFLHLPFLEEPLPRRYQDANLLLVRPELGFHLGEFGSASELVQRLPENSTQDDVRFASPAQQGYWNGNGHDDRLSHPLPVTLWSVGNDGGKTP